MFTMDKDRHDFVDKMKSFSKHYAPYFRIIQKCDNLPFPKDMEDQARFCTELMKCTILSLKANGNLAETYYKNMVSYMGRNISSVFAVPMFSCLATQPEYSRIYSKLVCSTEWDEFNRKHGKFILALFPHKSDKDTIIEL
jgi:hypothetical protein